jgi:hypothetical protein
MSDSYETIGAIFPGFAVELETLVQEVGRPDLVQQIRSLPVVDRCTRGEDNCAHFYTRAKPVGAYGAGHTNLQLPSEEGLVVLDLIDGRIVAVEVLDRRDVKEVLDLHLPSGAAG